MLEIFTTSSKKSLLILAILTFLYFLENFDRYLIAVSPIPYIDYSSYEYSILAGPAFAIVYTFGGLFFALGYTDFQNSAKKRIGKYAILSLSTFVFSAAFGLTALAENFWQQVIIRVVMGLAQSIITPFSTSLIKEYFPVEIMGSALGIFNTGVYFAFALSLSLGIYIYNRFGWQAGYLLFGLIGVAGSLLLPCLSMCKVSNDNTYKFLSVDDLDASVRGSEEKASFFLYSGAGNKPPPSFSSANSSATSSVMSPKVNSPVRNPVHNSDLFNTNDPPDEIDGEEVITGARKLTVNSMLSNSTNGGNSPKKSNNSFLSRIWGTIHEIAFIYWWKNPGIYLLCLATGVRLGGGYIWSSYTGVFFSDLFATQEDSIHCSYSYNPDDPHPDVNNVCGSDYPYCVDGDCKVLTEFPWHNQGMSAMHIESYMSWVPIVGSALGSFLGGLISDKITSYCDSTAGTELSMSTKFGSRTAIRAFICAISALISLPLVVTSFYLDYPGCFLIFIASGIVGEVYLGQTLTVIADHHIIPPRLITSSVALFMLVITIIGGSAPLLIPLVESGLHYNDVTIEFKAMTPTSVEFAVENTNADILQNSILFSLIGCYSLAGVLYFLAFLYMKSAPTR